MDRGGSSSPLGGRRFNGKTQLGERAQLILAAGGVQPPVDELSIQGVPRLKRLSDQPVPAAGDDEAEAAFLHHCEGAGDSLAFMLASRALTRAGRPLSRRWSEVSMVLQRGVRS